MRRNVSRTSKSVAPFKDDQRAAVDWDNRDRREAARDAALGQADCLVPNRRSNSFIDARRGAGRSSDDGNTISDGLRDREAFWRNLIAQVERQLFGWFSRTPCPPYEIEDLVAEVVALAVTQQENNLVGADDPWPILEPLVRAVWRQRKRCLAYECSGEFTTINGSSSPPGVEGLPATDSLPEERELDQLEAERRADEATRRLLDGIEQLPRRERQVILLQCYGDERHTHPNGLSYATIAGILGITASAARQYALQGRRRLANVLDRRIGNGLADQL